MPRPLRSAPAAAAYLLAATLMGSPARCAQASALLHWTAPGDNGWVGTATGYDVRRSTQPITAANFAAADTVAGVPVPAASGTAQACAVALPVRGVTYWFAMRSVDAAGNWSAVSNVVSFVDPVAGVDDAAASLVRFGLPSPNPARGVSHLRVDAAVPADADIDVLDAAGRHVRTLSHGWLGAGANDVAWNLRDDAGRPVAPGLYFVRARVGRTRHTRRIVVAG